MNNHHILCLQPQACPGIFSAGLDIREMYQPTEERLKEFWSSLQTLWLQLYGSKMASVALINVRFFFFFSVYGMM